MSRPKKNRCIHQPPKFIKFSPADTCANCQKLEMSIDELEALRLADYNGYEHSQAAGEMKISRPTFSRLVEKARRKSATFFLEGRILAIEGGNISYNSNLVCCDECGEDVVTDVKYNKNKCPACGSDNCHNMLTEHEKNCPK